MQKYLKWTIKNLEAIIGTVALTLMILLTCINICLRYFFNASSIALSEYSTLCMTWAVFLGAAEAYKRNQHFGMDFLSNHLPKKYRMILRQIIMIVLTVLFAYLTYHSTVFAVTTTKRTAAIQLPYFWVDIPAAIGFLSMTVYSLIYLYQSFFEKGKFAMRYAGTDSLADIDFDEEPEETK